MVIRVRWPIVGKRAFAQRYFAHRPLSGPTYWLYVVPSCWLSIGPTCTHGKLAHCWQVHVGPTYMTLSGHTYVGSTRSKYIFTPGCKLYIIICLIYIPCVNQRM